MAPHEVAVPILFFLVVGCIVVAAIFAKHRERIMMVEKGMSSEDIKALYGRSIRQHDPLGSLKWGILFVLAGAAILLGNFLHERYGVEEGAIIGLVILFVGLGLVIFYGIAVRKTGE